uniref:hypothetical protein n=1 Tax=Acetatifactor sp. TaxID=1872090 RepID=UPI0040561747
METNKMNVRNKYAFWESLYVLVLGLYPLRHIYIGLDLWDTGYNYANFQYIEHMDPMWFFSTYLSNIVGNFLMKLPSAGSLAGMNLYTGLFVSALALMGYFFCTKKLKISPLITFIGEFVAISLCWCPTAKLYDYLTYVLFLGCVMLLYQGLIREKKWYLFIAGICLGTNVLVRFSNVPEAAMIIAVWAYGVIEALEWRKEQKIGRNAQTTGKRDVADKSGALARTVHRTLWCLGGYLAALAVLFGYIGIRYGLDEYIAGIQRLFAMTDKATDYKAASMLMGMVSIYKENLYWFVRMLMIVLVGMLVFAFVRALFHFCKPLVGNVMLKALANKCCYGIAILLGIAMLVWLYVRGFCGLEFYSYDPILRPGILFLMLTMFIAVICIFRRNCPKEVKLISGMVLLIVLLTSIGSNNGVYPSINNLFLVAPYTIWQCAVFAGKVKERAICSVKKNREGKVQIGRFMLVLHPFPAKCVIAAFLAMFLFQSTMFGVTFVFAEATGVQNTTATVENNVILKGIQMSPERAEWLSSISAYVEENELQGKEVILYSGFRKGIPALSYYLQMPPAFNSWSELDSYSIMQMEADMEELREEIEEKEAEHPVVIVDRMNLEHLKQDAKWQLIEEFMEHYNYQQTFENEKFVMWEAHF